jgi:hypothetical protein
MRITHFWTQNPDLEAPAPHVLLEPWSIIFRQNLLNKNCSPPSPIANLVKFQLPSRLGLHHNLGVRGLGNMGL